MELSDTKNENSNLVDYWLFYKIHGPEVDSEHHFGGGKFKDVSIV